MVPAVARLMAISAPPMARVAQGNTVVFSSPIGDARQCGWRRPMPKADYGAGYR